MLTIGRHTGQRILLRLPDGRDVWIAVGGIHRSGSVRLSIDAPRDVEIWREELLTPPQLPARPPAAP